MFSNKLQYCIHNAFQDAHERRYEFITVEHLLLFLLDLPKVVAIIKSCGGDIDKLRANLVDFVNNNQDLEEMINYIRQPVAGTKFFNPTTGI